MQPNLPAIALAKAGKATEGIAFAKATEEINKPAFAEATAGKGGLAQLVERLHGMQEVIGSIPLSSTKPHLEKDGAFFVTIMSPRCGFLRLGGGDTSFGVLVCDAWF